MFLLGQTRTIFKFMVDIKISGRTIKRASKNHLRRRETNEETNGFFMRKPLITLMLPSQKKKTGALPFFESFILMQRLTVLSVIIHETTAHVMSSFDPLHALGLLVCIQRYPCRTRGFCFLHLF